MTTSRTARMLARYRAWADQQIFDAVAALPSDEAIKERPTLFKNMVHTLNHNYVVDLIWQAHLEGRKHHFTARDIVLHPWLDDLWQAQRTINAWFVAWSESQSNVTLEEEVSFTLTSGTKGIMTRGEILLHVVNHATYHRGWISDLFFQVPAQPPTTDLPVFLREQPPALR